METANGFSLIGIDSTDKIIRGFFQPSFRARIYTFKLRAPKKTGQISSGQIYWTIDGQKRALTDNIYLTIRKSLSDPALSLTLTPSKKTVYVGEQFYINLGFYFYEHFGGDLQATELNTGDDFIVHRSDAQIKREPVEGNPYESQATVRYAWLSPTKAGELKIPSAKFKYTQQGEAKTVTKEKKIPGGSFTSTYITQEPVEAEAQTPPVNITVKPLPTEGKPADFSGMVGSYSFNADFDRTNLKVGEAMTLTINIKGDGLPGSITDPKLPDFGEFRSVPPENELNKKIVGNKVITTKNIRVFLYPKKKGEFTIPEITYSWFNPSKKAYETAKAGPWNVVVEKGDAAAEAIFQAPVAQGPAAVQKQEIESLGSDIRFIHKVRESANNTAPYKSILYWVLFAAAVPFYLIVTFAVRSRRKHNSDAALVRKGKANKMLKARFADAREALKKGDAKALYAALENGLINYLSDKTNLEFKGMTRPQMKDELAKLGVKSETIAAIDNWLEKCAFARFAPVNPTKDEQQKMLDDVEKLCEELK